MSKYLNKDQILQARDIQTKEVSVPEWGGVILVKGMTGIERDSFEASIMNGTQIDMKNIRAKLVVKCIVDDNGKRIFNDDDIQTLTLKSAAALDRVFAVAQSLSGIGDKDLKDMVKNSETDQKEDSTSS